MKLADQITHVQLAGARGTDVSDWSVPLSSDDEFSEIVVNAVTPHVLIVTSMRMTQAGLDTLDSTDKFSLKDLDSCAW